MDFGNSELRRAHMGNSAMGWDNGDNWLGNKKQYACKSWLDRVGLACKEFKLQATDIVTKKVRKEKGHKKHVC